MKFKYEKILVIGDNQHLAEAFNNLLQGKEFATDFVFNFASSPGFELPAFISNNIGQVDLNNKADDLIEDFSLIISLHCKQIFPKRLVSGIKCINIHPGFNPYNRGWYPHVFSIINKMPTGATIHEMDEELDHGPIIVQQEVEIYSDDTSKSLYDRILDLEIKLFSENIKRILAGEYETFKPSNEGNVNYKKDYEDIRELSAGDMCKAGELIDRLRALSHENYQNAYFIDSNNRKVFMKIILEEEE